jgi:hypothetical protein
VLVKSSWMQRKLRNVSWSLLQVEISLP